jgi:hypothetical protein
MRWRIVSRVRGRCLWSRDGLRVELMLYAGNNLDKARRIFEHTTTSRPCSKLRRSA